MSMIYQWSWISYHLGTLIVHLLKLSLWQFLCCSHLQNCFCRSLILLFLSQTCIPWKWHCSFYFQISFKIFLNSFYQFECFNVNLWWNFVDLKLKIISCLQTMVYQIWLKNFLNFSMTLEISWKPMDFLAFSLYN